MADIQLLYPPLDAGTISGGFLTKLLDSLPRTFRKAPKLEEVFSFRSGIGRANLKYVSLRDGILYIHNFPLDTPSVTPEGIYPLSQYTLASLAQAIINSRGYSATVLNPEYAAYPAIVLYGEFTDYMLKGSNTTTEYWLRFSMDNSMLGKFLYPIAQTLNGLSKDIDDGESALYRAYAKGFWIDFWGDWLGVPRPAGMADDSYAGYLAQYSNTPRTNNMAMEDLLNARFGYPAYVTDNGYKFFDVSIDAALTNVPQEDVIAFVQMIKAAGTDWILKYHSNNIENFQSYFYGRYSAGGTSSEFKNSDANLTVSTRFEPLVEQTFGYTLEDGFMFGSGTFNGTTTGGAKRIKDSYTMQYV